MECIKLAVNFPVQGLNIKLGFLKTIVYRLQGINSAFCFCKYIIKSCKLVCCFCNLWSVLQKSVNIILNIFNFLWKGSNLSVGLSASGEVGHKSWS